LTVPWKRF